MTISKDLFLAVLSMDSYNRYVLSSDPNDTSSEDHVGIKMTGGLGTATVIRSVDIRPEDFQATAWNWNTGGVSKTVIAYRGTDEIDPDAYYGFATGFGAGFLLSPQANLAQQFYHLITGKSACAHLHATTSTHLHA